MSERSCGVPEERWIDLLYGRLNARDAEALLAHKDRCRDCGDVFVQWAELLGGERGSSNRPALQDEPRRTGTAAGLSAPSAGLSASLAGQYASPAGQYASPANMEALSPGRRRSLLLRAGVYAIGRRAMRVLVTAAKRPAISVVCGLGAIVTVVILLLHPFASGEVREAGPE
ncbi:hypothetical protein ACFSR7_23445 [Cohnella sp. GCM10020058]|uniref:hypothetical protein n=1 Tax=Cohnella sp. GCM10020058 TaxID=3317330 RepID=UPI00363DFC56